MKGRMMRSAVWPAMTLEEWSADAHANGDALNKAGWAFLEEHGKHVKSLPPDLFNNLKAMLRKAILTYCLEVAKAKVNRKP